MTEINKLGFYGKIPSNGDFVSRDLPRLFIDPWDQWLQESIATSQQQLGDDWLNNYLTGPIWRFAISKGVINDSSWLGILMPSVDSVGRYFPLTLVTPTNCSCELLTIADKDAPWFSDVEEIALTALDPNNNLESFNQNLESIGIPEFSDVNDESKNEESSDVTNSNYWRIGFSETETVTSNLNPLLETLILQQFPNFTLWWTNGSEIVEPSILLCDKLPPANGFSALMTGNWEQWGWGNKLINHLSTRQNDNENTVVEAL